MTRTHFVTSLLVLPLIGSGGSGVITYEGTETVHQLVVGRELTGINAF